MGLWPVAHVSSAVLTNLFREMWGWPLVEDSENGIMKMRVKRGGRKSGRPKSSELPFRI
jgi:hypothetical protein